MCDVRRARRKNNYSLFLIKKLNILDKSRCQSIGDVGFYLSHRSHDLKNISRNRVGSRPKHQLDLNLIFYYQNLFKFMREQKGLAALRANSCLTSHNTTAVICLKTCEIKGETTVRAVGGTSCFLVVFAITDFRLLLTAFWTDRSSATSTQQQLTRKHHHQPLSL